MYKKLDEDRGMDRKLLSVLTTIIMAISSFSICIISFIPNASADHHTQAEVTSLINSVNGTLTNYNNTLCYYNGTEGIPAKGTNYTEAIIHQSFLCIGSISALLPNISVYQDLLDQTYHNLYTTREDLMELYYPIQYLSESSTILNNKFNTTEQFIGEHFDMENATEEDYMNITEQLFNNSNFISIYYQFINQLFTYKLQQNNITAKISIASANFTGRTMNIISAVIERESSNPHYYMATNSTKSNLMMANASIEENITLVNATLSNASKESKSTLGGTTPKMLSHNVLLPAPNGQVAFQKASAMNINSVRYDFSWNALEKNGVYSWNAYNDPNKPDDNLWYDILDPTLKWTKQYSMSTVAVIKCNGIPGDKYNYLRSWYENAWFNYCKDLSSNPPPPGWGSNTYLQKSALWADWLYWNGLLSSGCAYNYIDALLDKFHTGLNTVPPIYNIKAYNIENEPNVWQPWCLNYNSIIYPTGTNTYVGWKLCWAYNHGYYLKFRVGIICEAVFTTYTTADLVSGEASHIRWYINQHNEMKNAKILVNLHGFGFDWSKECWKEIAHSSNVDALGIDLYRTHYELYANIITDMEKIAHLAWSFTPHKEWWLVETEGADGITQLGTPKCAEINGLTSWAKAYAVSMLGYYRLWGTASGGDYNKAYNIYTNPGANPTARKDADNKYYWECIRDI
jgi:hypothetical protein